MYIDQILYILTAFQKLLQTHTHTTQAQTNTAISKQSEDEGT